jgi:hypothetical protein
MNTQQIQQKYSYELDSTEGIYKVWHTENNWSTLIAMCKDAEKADFICKAANQFSLERYEAATTGELPATAIDLEHFLDYVGLNYTPVRFTDGVLWDLDDSEAPMSSEEVIQDYKEQFGSTPVAPKEGELPVTEEVDLLKSNQPLSDEDYRKHEEWINGCLKEERGEDGPGSTGKPLTQCMMGRDAECNHPKCPVTDEDAKNGRYCPLPLYDYRQ